MLTVSVVIPCYNGERYLAEALQSVNDQTRPPSEVIVVDDGSTDASVNIAQEHGAQVILQANAGEGAARNAGWRAATCDVVASLDADDRWRRHHLSTVVGLLEQEPRAAAAFGAVQRFGSRAELIRGQVRPGPPVEALNQAFESWLHTTISSAVRRDALAAVGGFDEDERYAVDFDLWLRLAVQHLFVATDEVTADWRMHPEQQSATPWRQAAAVYRYRRRFVQALAAADDQRASHFERLLTRVWVRELRDDLKAKNFRSVGHRMGAAPVVRPWSARSG